MTIGYAALQARSNRMPRHSATHERVLHQAERVLLYFNHVIFKEKA
jgi:hypothetical protein